MKANFIGGEWVATVYAAPNINPSDTNDVIGNFAQADDAQVRAAATAAHDAFAKWQRSPIQQRFDILDAAGTEILARRKELGRLLAREEGKTLPEAIGEAMRAGQIFKFFAGEAVRVAGDFVESVRPGVEIVMAREPVGPVAIISPLNFPLDIPA